MCSLDLDPCQVWHEAPVTARKQHECTACGAAILPGQPYLKHFNVFKGQPSREKCCFGCWMARQQFAEAHGQSFAPSNLEEMLRECIGENDDEEDEWRPLLASVLRRYRTSPARARHLAKLRAVMAEVRT